MIDPATIGAGLGAGKSVLQLIGYLRRFADAGVISAYFGSDGKKNEGAKEIEVELHPSNDNKAIWWYSVKPVEDYVFVRMPVIESCAQELLGTISGEAAPSAKYWRWVAPVAPGRIYGGEAVNVAVDFLIFGYKPKALLKHFSART